MPAGFVQYAGKKERGEILKLLIFFAGVFTGLAISYIIRKHQRKRLRISSFRKQPTLSDIKMRDQKEIQLIKLR